eukprot:TRINITY_DN5271_c0_g1_i2.p1 TRINITY_DN5271_c0_g1~~TRINITY_DN5271_c0_g1_i2.p1  ORF type:complete len:513 (-),score=139.61 TRINITY_DN5271_c0_g1_i2:35-1573(-)
MIAPAPKSRVQGEPVMIFFKVKDRVKKAFFSGSSLDDLNKLFLEKFPEFPKDSLRPYNIIHRESKIQYELDDTDDLYPTCVLEMKRSEPDEGMIRKRGGTGYTGIERDKIVLVMVGLPARGKTYVARKIARFLTWLGIPTRVFNVGEYRRNRLGAQQPHDFFDPGNTDGQKARLHMAVAALDDMISWMFKGGRVSIYDATNSTHERRQLVLSRCSREGISKVIFIESLCDSAEIIEANIRETKLRSPDYEKMDPEAAVRDFRERIKHYEKAYETIDDDRLQYIKLLDVGKKVIMNNITGYLPGRVVFFLMNLHLSSRPIWLTRHGESQFNAVERIGGDPDLTQAGDNYAHLLAAWIAEQTREMGTAGNEVTVWTSTLKRAIRTAQYIPLPKLHLRGLDEIDAGVCDGLTYQEIAERMPEEFAARASDKLSYRYPRGESYEDIIQRLEPVMLELERTRHPILIVSHQAPLRCLYGYLMGLDQEECPFIPMPLHTVISITPKTYGCEVKSYKLL